VTRGFTHLHAHTHFSMLDGAARIDDLFTACAQLGMDSLAITDHGNMFGAYEFWSKAREHGINPIIGMEGYVAPGSRHVRSRATLDGSLVDDTNPGEMYTHMTLLAETTAGMHNLFRLSSLASLEGMYYKPRMDRELLQEYAGGLIATTGCPSGEVARLLQKGQFDAACAAAGDYADIFGAGNYYVEYMDHGTEIERSTLADLHRLQQRLGLPAVATNDLHYVKPEDAKAHDALLCVQTKKTLDDPRRFRFEGTGYHLKSPAEMRQLWDERVPGACDNTLAIAQRCHVEFAPRDLMPHAEVPAGQTEDNWLRGQVARGLYRRFPGSVPAEHVKQAAYELDVICKMGYPGYFLVVADLVDYAREHGIQVGPGRGSVAGSLVAYALGITRLDPITHRLVFERFLNPERPSMPDIDLDFDDRRRGEMLEYVARRYGDDRVAQIVTYSEIKAKSAVKDAAHVLHGQPGYAIADRITKAMPKPVMGKDAPLAAVFDPEHKRYPEAAEVRRLYADDPAARQIIDTARGLEGLKRQWGVHAAGVIVSSQPLLDVLPIQRRVSDGAIITQFEMYTCETLGLLKMDFLGLRNLTVLADALANIEAATGTRIDLDTLPLTDKATYDLIARGDTLGVFQLDGGPIRDLLRRMAPTRFEDISAVLALYRPGPMGAGAHTAYADRKNGREPVTPIHPELGEPLADILGETYGLIVYQEQVMAIAQKVAGYTLGAADVLRRAMGKKKLDVLNREYERFAAGMHANGFSDEAIKTLWDLLIPFSDYAFNRAHSAGYGLLSYWTAYLKVHHPAEYMAALLTSTSDDKDRCAVYLAECHKMGIPVLPPDVNDSAAQFTAHGHSVRVGLGAIRNLGETAVAAVVAGRPYYGFHDYLRKVGPKGTNKTVVASLIKAGAFDAMGAQRGGLHEVHEAAIRSAAAQWKAEQVGQLDLFGGPFGSVVPDMLIPATRWAPKHQLAEERDMLGLYVSDHPLRGMEHALDDAMAIATVLEGELPDGLTVTVAGALSAVARKANRQGEPWAVCTLEDLAASIEVVCFARVYARVGEQLGVDAVVRVRGRVSVRDDRISVIADEVTAAEGVPV
jgi:DNA polymerase III subunit alpha